MKKIVITLCALTLSGAAYAANTAQGTGTVVIVSPMNITHDVSASLNFGKVASGTAGTVVVDTANNATYSGFTYSDATNASSDAFTITAVAAGQSYSVTLPTTATISFSTNDLTVDTFTATCTSSCTTTGTSNALKVGATLHVTSTSQPAGTYTGNYIVTLVY